MARSSKKYAGCLWGQKVDAAGVAVSGSPIFKFGNAYPLSLQMGVNGFDQVSALCDSAGQILETRNELDAVTGSLTLYQYGAEEIGLAIGATPVAMTGTGATVPAGDVVAPKPGEWVEVGHKNLTAFTLTNTGATVTYAKDIDYTINMHMGLWTPIATGAIVAAATLKQGYTYAAESGYKLEVAQVLQNYYRIWGSLKEIKSGALVAVNLKCVSLTSKNGFTLISEPKTEYESLEFDMKLITPAGHTTPAVIEGITAE